MNRNFILSFLISLAIGFSYGWYHFKKMGGNNIIWGMYGSNFLEIGTAFLLIGLVILFPIKTRKIGHGLLLSGFLLLLLGQSVCSGWIRF